VELLQDVISLYGRIIHTFCHHDSTHFPNNFLSLTQPAYKSPVYLWDDECSRAIFFPMEKTPGALYQDQEYLLAAYQLLAQRAAEKKDAAMILGTEHAKGYAEGLEWAAGLVKSFIEARTLMDE